jgi:hypothetical protein
MTMDIKTRRLSTMGRPEARRSAPGEGQIATRAYEIFLERGGAHGRDLDDWLQAEHELNRQRSEKWPVRQTA